MANAKQRARIKDELETSPADPVHLKVLFGICAAAICLAGCLYLSFLDRELYFDEVGLANPPYMFQHYGRITYPVHEHFDDMVIHPPTHYLVIGGLMRWGLTLTHAAAADSVVFLCLACALLVLSRFPIPLKFGLLFGTFLGALIWNDLLTVRPDISLALAWIAGLIALESARLSDWSPWRLAVGSLCLVYASAVHYPGIFAQTSVVIYAVWACFALPWRRLPAILGSLLTGPCLIGIPYLALFVIPFRNQIFETVMEHQGQGGLLVALHNHFETYDMWAQRWSAVVHHQPLVQSLLMPLWSLHIPIAVVGPLLFFAFRSSRGLAIAALPQVLFIVFGARHKQPGYSGYYAPETMLYLSAAIAVFFAGVRHLISRIETRAWSAIAAAVAIAGFTFLALHDKPSVVSDVKFTRDLNDLDVGRAVSREILGPSALVAATGAGVWYTGGAEYLYPSLTLDLLYPPTIANFSQKLLLSPFDAVVLDADQSWATWNRERVNLTSLLASGDLNLKGFWFGDRRSNQTSGLSLLLLGLNQVPVRGFASNGGKTYRFEPSAEADSVLYCAVCPIGDLPYNFQFDYYATYFLPWKNNDDPRSIVDPADPRSVLRFLLVNRRKFQQEVLPKAARCKTRYQIAGRLVEIDQDALVAELRRNDRPIKFYRNIPAALGGSGRLNAANTVRIQGALQLDKIHAAEKAVLSKQSNGWSVTTDTSVESGAVSIPIEPVDGVSAGYVYVRAQVSAGRVGLSVRNNRNVSLAREVVWEAHDPQNDIYIPVPAFQDVAGLVVRNLDRRGRSKILLRDAAVVTAH
jgi:hypothetical protein